ncbi:MAG TPA: hypothetical protein PK842_08725 [Smithella sp.]|jgi:hypothetical protein|nr:hypothetical protein [Smithella sp.]NMC96017.1 hypothetical protein [Deltaproteobacteria bacterium]OQC52469.1 MAG: hypothetical protein BWX55_01603 [Deltaproteobacteria bacterium ADurb.Bin022]HNQ66370.1 hypothetical protein [Smithella sp.]HOG10938.1 hypothetical protein [Smithella sp.]
MSHKLKKESDDAGIVITFSGRVEADDVDSIQEQINSSEGFPQLRYQIWDFSKAAEINITMDQIQDIAMHTALASSKNPKLRIAIIPRKASHNVLGKTFHTFEKVWGSYESKSFRDIHAAREWGESGKT